MGEYPEFELGVQIMKEEDSLAFGFDLLDPTKIVPEEIIPITPLGKMVLDRNPDNFFAETEQVAFHPGHVVPGIDFTNDPLLQGRLFSYLDTQLTRLGGPNFSSMFDGFKEILYPPIEITAPATAARARWLQSLLRALPENESPVEECMFLILLP